MKKFWSWGGRYIGVRQGEYLVSCEGKVLGRFYGNEIYNQEGFYIGELGRNDRIYKNRNKCCQRRGIFSYGIRGTINQRYRDYAPYPSIAGYEEFYTRGSLKEML